MADLEGQRNGPHIQMYPVQSRSAIGQVGGIATEVTTLAFSDRIMITVAQGGKIGQWFQVALEPRDASVYTGLAPIGEDHSATGETSEAPGEDDEQMASSDRLLPSSHLGARTLLGGSNEERETLGQLYSTHIADSIMSKRPDENRVLLVGLGLKPDQPSGDDAARLRFFDLMELVLQTT